MKMKNLITVLLLTGVLGIAGCEEKPAVENDKVIEEQEPAHKRFEGSCP